MRIAGKPWYQSHLCRSLCQLPMVPLSPCNNSIVAAFHVFPKTMAKSSKAMRKMCSSEADAFFLVRVLSLDNSLLFLLGTNAFFSLSK